MAVFRHCSLRASVIPLVWKQRAEEKRDSSKSSMEMVLMVEWRLSYTTPGFLGYAPFS